MSNVPEGMRLCPDCNGEGVVVTMDASPFMDEHEHPCTFPGCEEDQGLVPALSSPVDPPTSQETRP